MGAADCITAVMSYAHQYNTHNMHTKIQPHQHICIPIYKHTINKKEPKANNIGIVLIATFPELSSQLTSVNIT